MVFDFTDYVYSALITIFSMIMGMGYPLVNSSIGDIDNKYGSTNIVQSFVRERCYTKFQVSLALSIVAAILSPFILLCFNGSSTYIIVWHLVHTLLVLFLMVASIQLYQTIMKYKMPNAIAERFSKRISQDNYIVLEAEIAKYAARNNLSELYIVCTQAVCCELARQIRDENVQMSRSAMFSTPGRESRLTENAKKAIAIYTSIICDKDIEWGLYKTDIGIISVLLSSDKSLLEGDRLMIWYIVSEAALYGNKEWIKAYWTQATQYISFFDQLRGYWDLSDEDRKECDKEKREFKKMHIAMIGMLIEYERRSYVESLLYHSRTLPYSYPLCDNTFQTLYDDWKEFYCNEDTYHLIDQLNKYHIKGLDGKIHDEWKLIEIIEKSLALQLIRLDGIAKLGSYRDVLTLLDSSGDVEEKQYKLRMLSRMQDAVIRLFEEGLEQSLSGHNCFDEVGALAFLYQNIKNINGAINRVINNPTIDEQKRASLITAIKTKWEAEIIGKGQKDPSCDSYSAKVFPFEFGIDLPDNYILSGYAKVTYDSIVDSFINGAKSIVNRSYANAFYYNHPKHNFNIQYNDVGRALEKLKLNSGYMVLCNDFNIDRFFAIYKSVKFREDGKKRFFDNAEMMEIYAPTSSSFIVIIKKESLPYVEIDEDTDAGVPELSRNPFLYSNLQTIDASNYKDAQLRFKTITYIPADFSFVKFNMPYRLGELDLNKVKPIHYLL